MKISQQVRRPLVGMALLIVAGLYAQRELHLPALLLLALSAILIAAAVRFGRCRQALNCSAVLVLAAAYGAVERTHTPAGASLPVAEVLSSRQDLIGTVAEDPQRSDKGDAVIFRFKLSAVHVMDRWQASDATIRVRMKTPGKAVAYGECWRLSGWYRSYEKVYSGIEGSFYTKGSDAVQIREAPVSLKGYCYKMRRRAAQVLYADMQDFPEQVRLLQALMLGYRRGLPDRLYQTFSRTGTLHVFAISGLHVGVMATILIAALKLVGVSKPRWGLFLIPLLFLYVISTGMKPSAFRAFTMAAVYFAAPLFHRRPDSVSAIALAAVILLLINPLQLSDPGFLLSFTVVSGIVMVHLYVARRLSGFSRPAWAVPLAQIGGSKPVVAAGRTVALLALTSFAAWVFSVPLTAAFFHTVAPAALLANLAVIPLTFMIVLTGCLSLLSAPVWFSATLIFNHANRVFISLLITVIRGVETFPGAACRFVRSPPGVSLFLWYSGLVLLFAGPRRWGRAGAPLMLLAGLLWFAASPPESDGVQIAKEADAAVLMRIGTADPVLVVKDDVYSVHRAVRRLKTEGVNRLSAVAVCGTGLNEEAVSDLCQTFSVPRIWMHPEVKNSAELKQSGVDIFFSEQPQWCAGSGTVRVDLN